MAGDDDGFITLPPGMADSGTLRRPRVERPRTVEREEIVFVPTIPGLPPALPVEPEAHESAPVAPQPQVTEPMPSIPVFTPPPAVQAAPPAEEDFGETRVSPSRHVKPGWRLSIPGVAAPVTVDAALFLGRNPTATIAGAKALAIDDAAKSLSKTHALLEVDGGALYVSDLDSTNGVWVVPADGEAIEVAPGQRVLVPAGADLELGDVVIQVEHG